jgi:hypothetical protein
LWRGQRCCWCLVRCFRGVGVLHRSATLQPCCLNMSTPVCHHLHGGAAAAHTRAAQCYARHGRTHGRSRGAAARRRLRLRQQDGSGRSHVCTSMFMPLGEVRVCLCGPSMATRQAQQDVSHARRGLLINAAWRTQGPLDGSPRGVQASACFHEWPEREALAIARPKRAMARVAGALPDTMESGDDCGVLWVAE